MNILKISSDHIISNNEINFLGNKVKLDKLPPRIQTLILFLILTTKIR